MFGADRSWTSPELRAAQTAEALGMKATIEPLLRECDYGRWSGGSFDAVQAKEPDAIDHWMSDPDAAPHGGEAIATMIGRVATWLEAQHATSGRVVAFTHASIIRASLVCALGADTRCFWRIDVAPLSMMSLSGHNGRWNLSSLGPLVPS